MFLLYTNELYADTSKNMDYKNLTRYAVITTKMADKRLRFNPAALLHLFDSQ